VRITDSRALITCGWDDVPHLDEKTKRELLEATPPHLRDARSKGTPSLGAGAIYPIPESEITVPFMPIPDYWPRAYAMDPGWNRTAAIWGAWDPNDWTLYLYAEHYRGQAEPGIHAEAIKARGAWINGVIDPASRGSSQKDGEALFDLYEQYGLRLSKADNSVEVGLDATWAALSSGRMKVMAHLQHWFAEYRLYRRDEHGKIIKKNDHLMDCTRYLVRSGRPVAQVRPAPANLSPGAGSVGDARIGY
jgi:hypothetical protein